MYHPGCPLGAQLPRVEGFACDMTRGLGIKRISQNKLKLRVYSQAEELRRHLGKALESVAIKREIVLMMGMFFCAKAKMM